MTRSIAFFSDATVLGGHEIMCLEAVRHLGSTGQHHVHFLFWQGNTRLAQALQGLKAAGAALTLHPTPVKVRKANVLTAPLARGDISWLARLLASLRCQGVVLAQGRIENGTAGVLAAHRAGLPVVSYLPMAHTLADMGRTGLLALREAILQWHYGLPDAYITISPSMAQGLKHYVPAKPMAVVLNPLLAPQQAALGRAEARAALSLPQTGCLLALVGRVDFAQKGHDLLLNALAQGAATLPAFQVVVVGEGPDLARLQALVASQGLGQRVCVRPFHPQLRSLMSAFDGLVMPSRYEGVPLTMLEALAAGVPVLASRRDGMQDVLPATWLFNALEPANVVAVLQREVPQLSALAEQARSLASQAPDAARFGCAFEQALTALLHQLRP